MLVSGKASNKAGVTGRTETVAAIKVGVLTRKPRKTTVRVSVIAKFTSAISVRRTNMDMRMGLAATRVIGQAVE